MSKKGKEPIRITSEKSVVIFFLIILIIIICGQLQFRS